MQEIINEQAPEIQTAEAEQVKVEDKKASFGKFKSADALLSAYNSLQTEFTKRCQRIKELEDKITKREVELTSSATTSVAGITQKEKEDILKDYLIEVVRGKSDAIVVDSVGTGIKTPYSKPTSIAEAGKLAKELIKNNN